VIIEVVVIVIILMFVRKPLGGALLYAAISFMGLLFGAAIDVVLINAAISFVAAFVFLWLLGRFEGSILWWLILAGGLAGWFYVRVLPVFG
jgi:hypothetical protein